jgi:hypothetical protein
MPRPPKIQDPFTPVIVSDTNTDPRGAPPGSPVALPDPDELYPQTGLPQPDPTPTFSVLALQPPSTTVGSPDFTIRVLGQEFDAGTVILWNGSEEPTTWVSSNEVTTGVNMATVSVPSTVEIAVRAGDGTVSNTMLFAIEAAP